MLWLPIDARGQQGGPAFAEPPQFDTGGWDWDISAVLNIETGGFWFLRNNVRIPGDTGTEFSMLDFHGIGPTPYIRIYLQLEFLRRHNLRLKYAPLSKSGSSFFAQPVLFNQITFAPGVPTEGYYRFNTYILTYRFVYYRTAQWSHGAGVSAFLRDSRVELSQPLISDSNNDLRFVPLFHLRSQWHTTDRLSVLLDAEGLLAGPGRAFDIALGLHYRFNPDWRIYAGYRVFFGGATTDTVYNLVFINHFMMGVQLQLW